MARPGNLARQRDQRQIAVDAGVLRADLAAEPGAHMLDDGGGVALEGDCVGDAFEHGLGQ